MARKKRTFDVTIVLPEVYRRLPEEEKRDLVERVKAKKGNPEDQAADLAPEDKPAPSRRKPADKDKGKTDKDQTDKKKGKGKPGRPGPGQSSDR